MVYDREMGSMKILLMSPAPKPFLLFAKLCGGALLSLLQVIIFVLLAWIIDVEIPLLGLLYSIPTIFLTAFFLGSLGLILANHIKQLENFAGVMNFVIFPMFFLSSALYPLWKIQESSLYLYWICKYNPFTFAVEMLRFSLYKQYEPTLIIIVSAITIVCAFFAINTFKTKR